LNGWYRRSNIALGVYNFAERELELHSKSIGDPIIALVLDKDRMFVLQEHMQMDASHCGTMIWVFCITKYQVENRTKDWVQGKSYECPFSKELIVHDFSTMCLSACDGFVMVIFYYGWRRQHFWLLDLSTSEWSEPQETLKELHMRGSILFRAFWNIIP